MRSIVSGGPLSPSCKSGVATANEVSTIGYKSVPRAENSFAPMLVGDALEGGSQEAILRGMVDPRDLPGAEHYRRCEARKASICGQFPADWSAEDREIWIDGCGRRDICRGRR